jgi:hypothetical protein
MSDLPRLRAASIRAYQIKMLLFSQERSFVWMLFAFDRKAVVDMTISLQLIHEWDPNLLAFATVHECVWISNHYEGITCS